MTARDDQLLVSAVNGGGVFHISAGGFERWSRVDTTGAELVPGGALLARQAEGVAELRWLRGREVSRVAIADTSLDLHDLHWHAGRLLLVATRFNMVQERDANFVLLRQWSFPGEEDSQHINSVCVHEGRILASRFGRFSAHRGYKGASRGAGEVFDLESGEVLIGGLSQPHSLVSHEGCLWLCDSEASTLRCYRQYRPERTLAVDGYVRGLAFGAGGVAYAGLSRSRNAAPGDMDSACVLSFDPATMRELGRTPLPAAEVYDIVVLPPDVVEPLRAAALADAVAEYDTQVDAGNRALVTTLEELRDVSTRLHVANLRIATLEAELAAATAEAADSRRLAVAADRSASEESEWSAMLGTEVGRLHQALALAVPGDEALAAPAPSRAQLPVTGLDFVPQEGPQVSILIVARGRFAATRQCLEAIRNAGATVPYEVILVHDGAEDPEMARFASVPGLRYLQGPPAAGFAELVDRALPQVRGEYLHLLDDAVVVRPGWLDALLRSFALFHDCGLAGSTLVAPDGRLLGAGGIVWSDASRCDYGRGRDPASTDYAALREVDDVPVASVLLRTASLHALGGFDARYATAQSAATDLAFRLREQGLRTYFQPASVVSRDEVVSLDPADASAGAGGSAGRDRDSFRQRWESELARAQLPPGEHEFLARGRTQLRRTVLVVDERPPRTDRDAGSRAMWQLMRVLWLRGLDVRFWSHVVEEEQRYLDLLSMHAIEVAGNGSGAAAFEAWLEANGRYLDYVVLSRPHVAGATLAAVRRYSAARVVYYGHDVHHLRLERAHAVLGGEDGAVLATSVRALEEQIWREADLVLYPSEEETVHVAAWQAAQSVPVTARTVPLFAFAPGNCHSGNSAEILRGRDSVLFVGGFAHAPNADGVAWFVAEVWPLVRAGWPDARFLVVGSEPSARIRALEGDGVDIAGWLDEAALMDAYGRARVAVAPLRFGAGVKGKVLEAMREGVPCVTTPVGAQGLTGADGLAVAEDPAAFAEAILHLVRDDAAWVDSARDAQSWVQARFSPQAVWEAVAAMIDDRPYPDVAARMDAIARAGA